MQAHVEIVDAILLGSDVRFVDDAVCHISRATTTEEEGKGSRNRPTGRIEKCEIR
jgi:hypothetical protein